MMNVSFAVKAKIMKTEATLKAVRKQKELELSIEATGQKAREYIQEKKSNTSSTSISPQRQFIRSLKSVSFTNSI